MNVAIGDDGELISMVYCCSSIFISNGMGIISELNVKLNLLRSNQYISSIVLASELKVWEIKDYAYMGQAKLRFRQS